MRQMRIYPILISQFLYKLLLNMIKSEGWEVEFEIVNDTDEKLKAVKVTARGGDCGGPKRKYFRKAESNNIAALRANGRRGKNRKKVQKQIEKPWHDSCTVEVKECLTEKNIRHTTGTVDVSIDKQRYKLGTNGYVSMAHADGILAEGNFHSDDDGNIQLNWLHVIQYKNDAWIKRDKDGLLSEFSLMNDATVAVGRDETAETLWGEGNPDPKDALIEQGFQMRRVVLTPKIRNPVSK
mmetsp:Transcript_20084/g.22443  ORF Transcript_20084/g.22443 Transcript_20084/m.22443 type:complete len:238 (+) Transcript_20084:87-800(+)